MDAVLLLSLMVASGAAAVLGARGLLGVVFLLMNHPASLLPIGSLFARKAAGTPPTSSSALASDSI